MESGDRDQGLGSQGEGARREQSAGDSEIARRRLFDGGMLGFDPEDLLSLLPQRPPLLLIDRVISLVPFYHAVALKRVAGNEAGLDQHRHGFLFPSTLAVEALSQLAQLVASGATRPADSKERIRWPELKEIEKINVHLELSRPGPLHLTISRLGDPVEGLIPFAGEVTTEEGLFLEARLILTAPGISSAARSMSPSPSGPTTTPTGTDRR